MKKLIWLLALFVIPACQDFLSTGQSATPIPSCEAQHLPCIPERPWGDLSVFNLVDNWNPQERQPYVEGECALGVTACRGPSVCPEGQEDCPERWQVICEGFRTATPEKCNDGVDSDCDGNPNNTYDRDGDGHLSAIMTDINGEPCGNDCNDFDANVYPNNAESCDGIDNDCDCWFSANRDTNQDGVQCGCSEIGCDDLVDEKPNGQPISDVGVCVPEFPEGLAIDPSSINWSKDTPCTMGSATCINGEILCTGGVAPMRELCNGEDDNCNGSIDEPNQIRGYNSPCGSDIGACSPGYLICSPAQQDMICVESIGPSNSDPCNNINDDCDVDEDGDSLVDEDAAPILCTNGCPTFGYQYCEEGEYTVCDGPMPGDEAQDPCNDVDDDCDGQVDEEQECQCDPAEFGPLAPDCSPDEMLAVGITCGTAKKNCICANGVCAYGECYPSCDPWQDGVPQDILWGACPGEQCDGWDWNCWDGPVDGLVDIPCQCDPNSPVPEIAQLAREGNGCEIGACTAGSQSCERDPMTNTWQMSPLDCNAVGPDNEVCDELDNDCDALVDEDLRSFEKVDMVFAIDITGSMDEEIGDIYDAISAYAASFAQTEHRFALILYPAPYNHQWAAAGSPAPSCGDHMNNGVPYWNMTDGLVTVQDFLSALNRVLALGLECGAEPSYDVLSSLTSRQDPALVGWRPDAYPYIFLLGDEEAQTWQNITENAIAQAANTCDGIGMCPCLPPDCPEATNEFEIHCFVNPIFSADYDTICQTDAPGDNVYDINGITSQVLRNIFADVCLPSDLED